MSVLSEIVRVVVAGGSAEDALEAGARYAATHPVYVSRDCGGRQGSAGLHHNRCNEEYCYCLCHFSTWCHK